MNNEAIKPPTYLKAKGKAKFKQLAEQIGNINANEVDALGLLASSWETYLAAVAELQESGVMYRDTKGRLWNNPATNVADCAWKQIVKMSKAFGLMPERGSGEEPDNPYEEDN
jgi:P27 family predicted phage terminase small subunit